VAGRWWDARAAAIAARRPSPPVMLLDDVMSELDQTRRGALVDLLLATGGQAMITATDLEQVPGAGDAGVTRLAVSPGRVLGEAIATAGAR